jgi:hypothetical protein
MPGKTNVGQIASLKTDKDGRITADARNPSQAQAVSPELICPHCGGIWKTLAALHVHLERDHPAKGEPLTADMLKVGQRLQISDKNGSGLVQVVLVYPAGYKTSKLGPSVYLEGVTDHDWSGLFYNSHLRQFKAALIKG